MTWKYLQSEPGLFTVGFHDPSGKWYAESDFTNREEAAERCVRLNGDGSDGARKHWLEDVVRTQQEAIRGLEDKLSESERKWDYHNCLAEVLRTDVDVCVAEDDDRFGDEWVENPFCRIRRFYDRGDSSVGIWPSEYVALAENQEGTVLKYFLDAVKVFGPGEVNRILGEALAKKRTERAKVREVMCDEFRAWCEKNRIRHEGDAQEMLNDVLVGRRDSNLVAIGDAPTDEAIRWLTDFCRRWDEVAK